MIPVTKPFFPAEKEYLSLVRTIWQRQWLTNNGPLVNTLELQLKDYLGVKHFLFVNNGTMALQLAIKAFDLKGEIITTPFSFVATTSSIVWEGCKPVFVDIDPLTFNIDAAKIEAAITPQTSAILATHVFGNPCDIEAIEQIAAKYHLKVIYDAAHCFGTKYKGRSVFEYGDISITSFHATKLFHTVEGGGVFSNNPDIIKKMAIMRNFGYSDVDTFSELGVNAKNSELHAAMGLCNLKHISAILNKRKELYLSYLKRLANLGVSFQTICTNSDYNYAYFPVLFDSEESMLKAKQRLELEQIYCRRYFYPSLTDLPYLTGCHAPVCHSVASRILCLPLYHTLNEPEQDLICRILLRDKKPTRVTKKKVVGITVSEINITEEKILN